MLVKCPSCNKSQFKILHYGEKFILLAQFNHQSNVIYAIKYKYSKYAAVVL